MAQQFDEIAMMARSGKGYELLADFSDHTAGRLTFGSMRHKVALDCLARADTLVPGSQRCEFGKVWKSGRNFLIDDSYLR